MRHRYIFISYPALVDIVTFRHFNKLSVHKINLLYFVVVTILCIKKVVVTILELEIDFKTIL